MRVLLVLQSLLLLIVLQSHAQGKTYVYYFDSDFKIVPKDNAVIVGRGAGMDTAFLVRFYTIKENRLVLAEMFKDSTLNILHGNYVSYHINGNKAETAFYQNNLLHGQNIKWDSLGRTTDSVMYYEDMPGYLVKYSYGLDGSRQAIHEFGNNWAGKWPDEKAVVITPDGTVLSTAVWKNLVYTDRYSFKQDKIAAGTYMIVRFSDAFFNNMVANDPKPKESDFFKTGQNFNINETDINGNRLKSKDLKGKVLVINYWFIGCPPCRREMPELNEMVKEYKDSANVKFIGVCLDDETTIKEFLKQQPFQYQIVADGSAAAHQYGIHLYPTHVIVDKEGKVYFHTVSSPRQLFYWMKKSVNELLTKQEVQK